MFFDGRKKEERRQDKKGLFSSFSTVSFPPFLFNFNQSLEQPIPILHRN